MSSPFSVRLKNDGSLAWLSNASAACFPFNSSCRTVLTCPEQSPSVIMWCRGGQLHFTDGGLRQHFGLDHGAIEFSLAHNSSILNGAPRANPLSSGLRFSPRWR